MDCILCGKCLEVCPLLRATGREELGPRAKADLSALLRGDAVALDAEDVARLAGLCLGCRRCREKCPQGVDVPALVAGLRAEHPDFRAWLWKTWLKRARELWPSSGMAAKLIPEKFQPERLAPFLKALSLLRGGPHVRPFVAVEALPDLRGETVLLFSGCTARYVRKEWRRAAEKLLEAMNAGLHKDKFECCGMGLESAGFGPDAARMREKNIRAWRRAGKPRVVTLCVSCHKGLADYADGFEDAAEAGEWAEALTPISALLLDGRYMLTENAPARVGYHRPCHATGNDLDHALLASVLGERLPTPDGRECCGFGGIMQLGAPELCSQVNERCWQSLAGSETVITGCSACAAQLTATAPEGVRVGHWLEMFDL
ncbi:(Fe-S)-binding protein [Salidesulfovibrio onnuriiensis]|uniref:(Fe-S)-binding protein n=1 Tax=Salidesulfovibrio onnuriiensis TaxID=2583823 RepID=UPI0011CA777B|nr:(Fe-S)-binding protein [Salidesulfovibrio onnuriiensis]